MEQIDYTSPEFWAKAPADATHFGPENDERFHAWYKQLNGKWMCFLVYGSGKWVEAHDCELKAPMIARPELPPTWNGTGLPPVGTVCEGRSRKEKLGEAWGEVIVLAHRLGQAVVSFTDCERLQWCGEDDLRPIRTHEQIEADERKLAIVEMQRTVSGAPLSMRKICESLYDAGYRKIDTSQPSPAEISSDIKHANLSLLAEKALAVYATRKEPAGSVVAVNLLELSDLRDLAVSLKDN